MTISVRRCAPGSLAVSVVPGLHSVSVMQERVVGLRITNTGSTSCSVRGYPDVAELPDVDHRLRYHRGGYFMTDPVDAVTLEPNAYAGVFVARFVCDEGDGPAVTSLSVRISGSAPQLVGVREMVCGGQDPPGNNILVSPYLDVTTNFHLYFCLGMAGCDG